MRVLMLLVCSFFFFCSSSYAASSEDLINRVSKDANITKKEAKNRVNQVFFALAKELEDGKEVGIRGFGTFWIQKRGTRNIINPRTKEKIKVPAKSYPKFRSSDKLKKQLNS